MASFPITSSWTLNAEAGLHLPLGSVEPYFTLGVGYAPRSARSIEAKVGADLDVNGFDVRGGFGWTFT